jgi:hypothetical protein
MVGSAPRFSPTRPSVRCILLVACCVGGRMQVGMQAKGQRKGERVPVRRLPIDPTPEFCKSMKAKYLSGLGDSHKQVVRASLAHLSELPAARFGTEATGHCSKTGVIHG